MTNLTNKTIFVSGGTGSFGRNFINNLLKEDIKKIIVFSRDEYKQFWMMDELKDSRIEYVIGDIRDFDRLRRKMKGASIVVHSSAYKQIPILERNPSECIQTNILGSENIIKAALDNGVEKTLLISSDKAVYPINVYGASKLCAEKLFIQANDYNETQKFSVVRYGNVAGSRGSVIEKFINKKDIKEIGVTDTKMTRFWLTLEDSYELVMFALNNMIGGEIFVPKPASMKVTDLLRALIPGATQIASGKRPGEKLHEILMTKHESERAYEIGSYFVILPDLELDIDYEKYMNVVDKVDSEFEFTSDKNDKWFSEEDMAIILNKLRNGTK